MDEAACRLQRAQGEVEAWRTKLALCCIEMALRHSPSALTHDTMMKKGMILSKTRDEIAQAYKSEPWWYDVRGFFILTFAYNSTLFEQLRFFGPNFGSRHLEVACGTGTLLELVLRFRRWKRLPKVQITGVDYAESMLAGARHRFRNQPEIQLLHADAAAMPFATGAFDTVNVANAIHCFPDVRGAMRDIRRVLAPGGVMAANVLLYPNRGWPLGPLATAINDWGQKKGILYTPYEMNDILEIIQEAGFEIVQKKVSGNCANILARNPLREAR